MNNLDLFFGLLLVYGAYSGFKKGIISQLGSLVGLFAAFFFAINFYSNLDYKIKHILHIEENYVSILSFILIFILTIIIVKIISKLITNLFKVISLGLVNQLIGAFFGSLKYLILISIFIFLFSSFNEIFEVIEENKLNESFIFTELKKLNEQIIKFN